MVCEGRGAGGHELKYRFYSEGQHILKLMQTYEELV